MIELLLLTIVGARITTLVKQKGRRPGRYAAMTVLLLFGGELLTGFIARLLGAGLVVGYVCALVGAALGTALAFRIANAVPIVRSPPSIARVFD